MDHVFGQGPGIHPKGIKSPWPGPRTETGGGKAAVWGHEDSKCPEIQMIWTVADQGQETLLRAEMGRGPSGEW